MLRPGSGPGTGYPPALAPEELVISDLRGNVDTLVAEGPGLEFLGWGPADPAVPYRSGEEVFVYRHDVDRSARLHVDGGNRTPRWAGDAVACARDGQLLVESPGAEQAPSLVATGVRSFDVVPGPGTCPP